LAVALSVGLLVHRVNARQTTHAFRESLTALAALSLVVPREVRTPGPTILAAVALLAAVAVAGILVLRRIDQPRVGVEHSIGWWSTYYISGTVGLTLLGVVISTLATPTLTPRVDRGPAVVAVGAVLLALVPRIGDSGAPRTVVIALVAALLSVMIEHTVWREQSMTLATSAAAGFFIGVTLAAGLSPQAVPGRRSGVRLRAAETGALMRLAVAAAILAALFVLLDWAVQRFA
jgi:hypothetical protein